MEEEKKSHKICKTKTSSPPWDDPWRAAVVCGLESILLEISGQPWFSFRGGGGGGGRNLWEKSFSWIFNSICCVFYINDQCQCGHRMGQMVEDKLERKEKNESSTHIDWSWSSSVTIVDRFLLSKSTPFCGQEHCVIHVSSTLDLHCKKRVPRWTQKDSETRYQPFKGS